VERSVVFADRADAGRRLAGLVRDTAPDAAVVAGIPRGGIVVAAEVATALGVPLRAIVARKVGAPGHPELALGAVGPGGAVVLDRALARRAGADRAFLRRAVAAARAEVDARLAALPAVATPADVAGRTVVVVDDGVATGATASAVGRWLGTAAAARRVLALPVAPPDTLARLRADYDVVVALETPAGFVAVGQWYRDFRQVTDDEVTRLLA
jgi:putative phosphoribosyl transferase